MISPARRMLGSRMVSDARLAAGSLAALVPVLIRRTPALTRRVPATLVSLRVLWSQRRAAVRQTRSVALELWTELRAYCADRNARTSHLADARAAFRSLVAATFAVVARRTAAIAGAGRVARAAQRAASARWWLETVGPRAVAAVRRDIADGTALSQRFAAGLNRVASAAASALRPTRARPNATLTSPQVPDATIAQATDLAPGGGETLAGGWLDQVLREQEQPEAVATPRVPAAIPRRAKDAALEMIGRPLTVAGLVKGREWARARRATGAGARQLVRVAENVARETARGLGRLLGAAKGALPDAAKVVAGGAAVIAVIAAVGYGAVRLGSQHAPVTAMVSPSPAVSIAPPPPPALRPAAAAVPAMPNVLPLSRFNPVTGPDRPPLPEDANGPQGSLRTTGTYEVALTFDDGPDPRWTPQVLDLLRQYRIKATFCMIGVNVIEFPELVRDVVAEGHTLCNHSWIHDIGLGNRPYATIVSDMKRTNDAIRAAAPRARVSYFRHPGGAWTQAAVNAARSLGMTSLHWDVDPRDWLRPGARSISSAVVASTGPGSIVLMHDGGGDRRGTADALRSILPNLSARFPLVALPPGVDPPKLYGIHLPVHVGQE